jgi:hypothetical protein
MTHHLSKNQTIIQITLTGITDGTLGNNLFQNILNTNHTKKTQNITKSVFHRCENVSDTFMKKLSCFGNHTSHSALFIWVAAIVNQTHIINQWSAVEGISARYFVTLKK